MRNMKPVKLNLIVAVCQKNRGIGLNGSLPWRIPEDMKFFKKITTETQELCKQNAVVMGRKTWESLPEKFRPLAGRLNLVVSTTLRDLPAGVQSAKSFEEAVRLLSVQEHLENIFVIGGASMYKAALDSGLCDRIYLTEVLKPFDCDTFLPEFNIEDFKAVELPSVSPAVQLQNDIPFRFTVYEKLTSDANVAEAESAIGGSGDNFPPVAICAAVDLSGGFGKSGSLPWPYIKKDFEQFISLVTQTENQDKKVAIIKGRKTWEGTSSSEERFLSSAINIIVSKTLRTCPKSVSYLVQSFETAMEVALRLWKDGLVERIWILGGQEIFQAAINSSLCRSIYLTKVLASFDCDVFFPPFEHRYSLTGILREELDEDSRISIRCEVYEKSL